MFITKTKLCSLTKVCCIKNSVVIDATGEMGPFYNYSDTGYDEDNKIHSSWYNDYFYLVSQYTPWVSRGGAVSLGIISDQIFSLPRNGKFDMNYSFRIAIAN